MDAALKRGRSMSVCTALCMRVSGEHRTIAAGGHPLPLILGDDGVRELGRHGTLLGAFADPPCPETPFVMQPGETLVAITDGVTDTVGAGGERFGVGRLRRLLAEVRGLPPMAIRQQITAALEEFQVGGQADDTAIVVMRFSDTRPHSDVTDVARVGLGVGG